MGIFGSKETKQEKQARIKKEAAEAKMKAEIEAKIAAKQERKKVEKVIAEIDKSEKEIIAKAAEAKSKGYMDVYKQQIGFIKIARARKAQAEKFLFQVDSMEKMKSISDSSVGLIDSMTKITNTLGKLSIDPAAMMEASKNFAKTQQQLEMQGMQLEQVTSSMEAVLPDDADLSDIGLLNDDAIDMEINSFIIEQSGVLNAGAGSSAANADTAELKKMLEI